MKEIIIKVLLASTYIGMIYMNFLANSLPLNNKTTGAISDTYQTYFTPAGFTFSIWGIIYILLGVATFRLLQSEFTPQIQTVAITLSILAVFNSLWLVTWHYEKLGWSVIVMLIMLGLLAFSYINSKDLSIVKSSISLYMGWISIATVANISIFITSKNTMLFMNNERIWFYIILLVGILIVGVISYIEKDIIYSAVFVWAYFGILSRHLAAQDRYLENRVMIIIPFILTILILVHNIYQVVKQ